MILSLILGFLLGAAALLFAIQNTAIVSLSFLGWQFESSLALLTLIAFALGVIVCLLISIPSAVKDGFKLMSLRKENKRLVQELDECRKGADTTVNVIEDSSPSVLDIRNG